MVRDGFGQSLMAATADLSAADDNTLQFKLRKPFPHLPVALAGCTTTGPCIMPERLARTDPFNQVVEMVGSGPYRFLHGEFNAGVAAAYERFEGYVRRTEAFQATPQARKSRISSGWNGTLGDAATAAAALLQGEVDWLDRPARISCRC